MSATTPTAISAGSTSTASAYGLLGSDRQQRLHRPQRRSIRGFFAAAEPSIRLRLDPASAAPALFASGDGDPFDNIERGFDAIFENPIFAGADTSYWIRQTIPFAGGGRAVSINSRNGILNNLRSSKEQGQSNFVNPGTMLLGVGADFDITPGPAPVGQRQPSLVPPDRRAARRCA